MRRLRGQAHVEPMNRLKAFAPPTLETMAEHYLQRAYHEARMALQEARYECFREANYRIGRAEMAVSVLYDLGDVRAYLTLRSVERAKRALIRRDVDL